MSPITPRSSFPPLISSFRLRLKLRACLVALSAALVFPLAPRAAAADGTWTSTAGGTWSTTGNWSGGTVADGSAFTADFSTLDITAATTVNLDSARTIGTLHFGDTSSGGSWVVDNNGSAANVLTLGGAATITVDAMASVSNTSSNVTISAVIDGTSGLTKNGTGVNSTGANNTSGTGTLTLSGANTYTGATNIETGSIRAANSLAFGGVAGGKLATNVVTVSDGARLILSGVNIANTVNINGAYALATVGSSSNLSGIVNLNANSDASVNNGGNYTLTFSGSLNLSDYVLNARTTGTNNGIIISGVVTGSASSGITKFGAGPLTMSGDGSGYAGTTALYAGDLQIGSKVWVTPAQDRHQIFETTVNAISPRINSLADATSPLPNRRLYGRDVVIEYPRAALPAQKGGLFKLVPGQTIIIHTNKPGDIPFMNRVFHNDDINAQ